MDETALGASHRWKYEEYSPWARQLAKTTSRKELQKELKLCDSQRERLSASHLKAIEKTASMSGCSSRRAATRNSMTGNYERFVAVKNALEIHDLYPEHALNDKMAAVVDILRKAEADRTRHQTGSRKCRQ